MDNTNMPKITAKINRLLDVPNSKIRADATVYIADAFAIRGVKVIETDKGLYVNMPSQKYEKNGEMKYQDVCYPVSAEVRNALTVAVVEAYDEKRALECASQEQSTTPNMAM